MEDGEAPPRPQPPPSLIPPPPPLASVRLEDIRKKDLALSHWPVALNLYQLFFYLRGGRKPAPSPRGAGVATELLPHAAADGLFGEIFEFSLVV